MDNNGENLSKKFDAICFCLIFALPSKKGLGDLVTQLVEHPDFNKSGGPREPSEYKKK